MFPKFFWCLTLSMCPVKLCVPFCSPFFSSKLLHNVPHSFFPPWHFLFSLSLHSPQICSQHIIWGPERFHIQQQSEPECHLRSPSLHLVPPAGSLRPANLDPPGTLAQGENSDGPSSLAKPSRFWRRWRLAPTSTVAHASSDTGGAPICIYPWSGFGWVMSCWAAVPGPAYQWLFSFGRTFPEPQRNQWICSHRSKEMLLWLLHWSIGEAGGGHGLYFRSLHCWWWEIRGV